MSALKPSESAEKPGMIAASSGSSHSKSKILPLKSFKYLGISILAIFGGLLFIEKGLLSSLEQEGQVSTLAWQEENQRINENNYEKNLATGSAAESSEDWVWHSAGLQVSEVSPVPYRILVMGDSFVWGDGYANVNDIWWRQLDRELTRRGFSDVEVIAAGMNGASTRQQLEQAQTIVDRYDPDLIIWGYVTNDPDEQIVKRFDYTLLEDDAINQVLSFPPLEMALPRLNAQLSGLRQRKLILALEGDEYGYEYANWEAQLLENQESFDQYQQTIEELSQFVQDQDIFSFMVTLPNSPHEDHFKSRYAPILPLFDSQNVPTLDLISPLVEWARTQRSEVSDGSLVWGINPANGHPGAASTYFYATQVADFLEGNFSEVLGSQTVTSQLQLNINDWVPYNLDLEQSESGVVTFTYPESEELMLRMPVERTFVQLNLEFPIELNEIQLTGSGLEMATLDVTTINDIGFDDGTVTTLETQSGTSLSWDLEAEGVSSLVNTIRISANFLSEDRELSLRISPETMVNSGS